MQGTQKLQGGEPTLSPSHIHKSRSGHLWAGFRANAVRERAADVFGEKPYSERWRPAYMGANVGGYAFQALGAALAYTAVADLAGKAAPAFPHVVGPAVAVVVLIGIEYGKRALAGNVVTAFLRSSAVRAHERVPVGAAVLLAALVALSVASSWRGAELIAYRAADQSEAIETAFGSQADSIRAHYVRLIENEERAMKDFKESVSWRGHIDFRKPETRSIIAGHRVEIARLRDDLREAEAKLIADEETALTANRTDASGQALLVACLSLAAEALALICIRFGFVYLHRVFVEATAEGWAMPDEVRPDLAQLVELLANRLQLAPHVSGASIETARPSSGGIGFAFAPTHLNGSRKDESRQDESRSKQAPLGDGNRRCEHCEAVYTYKTWNQKYCSTACRIAAWEARTGKKFTPKKT